jgi:hypothetical protein
MLADYDVCPCTGSGLYEVAGFCVLAPTRPTFDPASAPAPAADSTCGGCGEPACDGAHLLSLLLKSIVPKEDFKTSIMSASSVYVPVEIRVSDV